MTSFTPAFGHNSQGSALEAYRGSVDAEGGETLADALGEVDNLIAGDYGRFLPAASFKLACEGEVVSAALVTLQDGGPFLAFVMTHPGHKRRGLARRLLLRSCAALGEQGHAELTLVVTDDNAPALRLYRRLGFADV